MGNQLTDEVQLTAPPPAPPQGQAQIVGNTGGIRRYFYWVVAHFPIGSVVGGPYVVRNAPSDEITPVNFVRVVWESLIGADSYDLLRTDHNRFPVEPGPWAVATDLSVTMYEDMGAPLAEYDPTGLPYGAPVRCRMTLNNRDYSRPTIEVGACQFKVSRLVFDDGTSQDTAASGEKLWKLTGNNGDIYYDAGKVGIGFDDPAYQLDVQGDVNISADNFGNAYRIGGAAFASGNGTFVNFSNIGVIYSGPASTTLQFVMGSSKWVLSDGVSWMYDTNLNVGGNLGVAGLTAVFTDNVQAFRVYALDEDQTTTLLVDTISRRVGIAQFSLSNQQFPQYALDVNGIINSRGATPAVQVTLNGPGQLDGIRATGPSNQDPLDPWSLWVTGSSFYYGAPAGIRLGSCGGTRMWGYETWQYNLDWSNASDSPVTARIQGTSFGLGNGGSLNVVTADSSGNLLTRLVFGADQDGNVINGMTLVGPDIRIPNLATSDPGVSGQLWVDGSGVLHRSA